MRQDACEPGVLPIIAHRVAANTGLRSLDGNQQLMAWYPGSFDGEAVEDRTAAGITWLTGQLAVDHLVLDRHDNSNSFRYACVGRVTTAAALAAAHIMHHEYIEFARWSKFRNTVPRGLCVEEAVPEDSTSRTAYFQEADRQLRQIAALGRAGLRDYYYDHSVGEQFTFLEILKEVAIADPQTKLPISEIIGILPELEAAAGEANTFAMPVELDTDIRKALGLPLDIGLWLNAGSYKNRSAVETNTRLGMADDRKRRVYWSGIMTQRSAPQPIAGTDLLTFEDT